MKLLIVSEVSQLFYKLTQNLVPTGFPDFTDLSLQIDLAGVENFRDLFFQIFHNMPIFSRTDFFFWGGGFTLQNIEFYNKYCKTPVSFIKAFTRRKLHFKDYYA